MALTVPEIYAAMTLLMAAILHAIKVSDAETPEASTSSLLVILCSTNRCRNGECYIINTDTRCICDNIFTGDHCEHVNLDETDYSIIGTVVIFKWARPPRLKGYSFIYYELENPTAIMYKRNIFMKDNENSILVGNFKGGRTLYRICIEDEYLADRAVQLGSKDMLTNCLELMTQPDYHTLAGWCLAVMLASVAILLMYSQRRKIALIYFHKPPIPQMNDPDLKTASATPIHVASVSNSAISTR